MNNSILTIMKKELARFFGDRRMLLSLFLPGIMIYVLYSIMGQAMMDKYTTGSDYVYTVEAYNMPDSFAPLCTLDNMEVTEIADTDIDAAKEQIVNKELDLLLVFPLDFDQAVEAYDVTTATGSAPAVKIYYNALRTESAEAYTIVEQYAENYEAGIANKFDVNPGEEAYNLSTDEQTTTEIFSMMLPMLLLVFLFSGCMAIAPESIVGEKERGTIATLLVTPMKRSDLALGKIFSLSIIGVISGAVSFVATMLSLPKLMGSEMGLGNATVYSAGDYFLLCLIILSTVLVIIGAISVISGLSKSVKEASTYIMPLMIAVMMIGLTSMFSEGCQSAWYWYLLPIYNSVQCMTGIFSMTGSVVNYVIGIVANLGWTLALTFALAKIFDSEKIMN